MKCEKPRTVKKLRSFLGACKVIARCLKDYALLLSPLEKITGGKDSKDVIEWTEELDEVFRNVQKQIGNFQVITVPIPSDALIIEVDAAKKGTVHKEGGIGATLYFMRSEEKHLAGFFSAPLKGHQAKWCPCEIEALSIAMALKH